MKYLLGLFMLVLLASCNVTNRKYRIHNGSMDYYTDNYTKDGNCVRFQYDPCGCGQEKLETVIICGNYTITTLK